jgi:hypothetical protein
MSVDEFYCFGPIQSRNKFLGEVSPPYGPGDNFVQCPVNPKHQPLTKRAWEDLLRSKRVVARLKHSRRDQMMIWTTPWTYCLIHERLATEMHGRGFTGYSLAPAEVILQDGTTSSDYHRFAITGWGGLARPESGIRLISECKGCTLREYSPLADPSKLIDESQWTGEDFFAVWPLYYDCWFMSRRAAEYVRSSRTESCIVRSLDTPPDVEYPLGFRYGVTVGSVEEMLPARLARKYRRPPEIL